MACARLLTVGWSKARACGSMAPVSADSCPCKNAADVESRPACTSGLSFCRSSPSGSTPATTSRTDDTSAASGLPSLSQPASWRSGAKASAKSSFNGNCQRSIRRRSQEPMCLRSCTKSEAQRSTRVSPNRSAQPPHMSVRGPPAVPCISSCTSTCPPAQRSGALGQRSFRPSGRSASASRCPRSSTSCHMLQTAWYAALREVSGCTRPLLRSTAITSSKGAAASRCAATISACTASSTSPSAKPAGSAQHTISTLMRQPTMPRDSGSRPWCGTPITTSCCPACRQRRTANRLSMSSKRVPWWPMTASASRMTLASTTQRASQPRYVNSRGLGMSNGSAKCCALSSAKRSTLLSMASRNMPAAAACRCHAAKSARSSAGLGPGLLSGPGQPSAARAVAPVRSAPSAAQSSRRNKSKDHMSTATWCATKSAKTGGRVEAAGASTGPNNSSISATSL
mmetsp:Transcript_81664/g.264587  ORF Transcript_81664/g.264587 Transcript_81664/m.264587 type:complete len:455 (+) Transcript_81664:1039-2403(+)